MRETTKNSSRENEMPDEAIIIELAIKELGEISELESTKLGD